MIRVAVVNGDVQVYIETDCTFSPDVVDTMCRQASHFYRDALDDDAAEVEEP